MSQLVLIVLSLLAAAALALGTGVAVATYLLAAELRLFLQAPSFYARKLLGPPPAEKTARKIVARIQGLLPASSSYGQELRARVGKVPATLETLARQRDRITLYLEYDVYGDGLGDEVGRQDPAAIQLLERRRKQLDGRIETALGQLKRIETRVAARALASPDHLDEGAVQAELGETLEELDLLIQTDKQQGLLGE